MSSLQATVSGSFNRHLSEVEKAVQSLNERGVKVLSPSDPRIVDKVGTFLFVASDRHRSIRLVQDRHFASIAVSDFLWLVCADGYVGQSASMEVGFAVACGRPVFSATKPSDVTLRRYVIVVKDIGQAIDQVSKGQERSEGSWLLLIDPAQALNAAHDELDKINALLRGPRDLDPEELPRALESHTHRIKTLLTFPDRNL